MLTAAAYKFAVTTMVPPVAYLTVMDKYIAFCWLTIMLSAFAGVLVDYMPTDSSSALSAIDKGCFFGTAAVFLLGHVYFAWLVKHECQLSPNAFVPRSVQVEKASRGADCDQVYAA